MDDRRFDEAARLLGGASSRRAAVAALAGLAAGAAAWDAGAKRKRKRCDPACAAGQTCVKGGCACDDGGTACAADCCGAGQRCEGGVCVAEPEPTTCVAFGQPCKNVGRPCCDGLACGSGQGGEGDVACYVPAGGPCQTTADCVYDSTCEGGACVARPRPTPAPRCRGSVPVTGDPAVDGEALRALAEDPAGPATITLCAGVYRASKRITVIRDLAIRAAANAGGEVVLDGGWSGGAATDGHQVIGVIGQALPVAVALEGITLRNGRDDLGVNGGCVHAANTGGSTLGLALDRVRVSACTSTNGGGIAIVKQQTGPTTLSLRDSDVSDCVATGTASPNGGGGLHTTGTDVAIDGCTISRNAATGDVSRGGGVYVDGGTVTVGGTTVIGGLAAIDGNRALSGGGFFVGSGSTVTLGGTTLVGGNAAIASGGGFVVSGGTVTLDDATLVSGNSADNGGGFYSTGMVSLGGATRVTNNEARDIGGGFFIPSNTVELSGTARVDGNRAKRRGAGFYRGGDSVIACPSGTPKVCANPAAGAAGCDGSVATNCTNLPLCSDAC